MENFSAKHAFAEIRNFLAGRFVGATRDEFFLEEIIKLMFCKYKLDCIDTVKTDEIVLSGLYRKTFKDVLKQYPDIYSNKSAEIELDPVAIKYIDTKFSSLDLHNIGRDVIGGAYEIFMGDVIKGQSGQFFTPQNAAKALVRMVSPALHHTILDPACGAGGFLVATLKHWGITGGNAKKYGINNLHGVDKDEYLTRLAKIHLACLVKASSDIKCADSLLWNEDTLGCGENAYDIIFTNPPFGASIQTGTIETLSRYKIAYKYKRLKNGEMIQTSEINETVPPQVVFMEKCIRLVKPNGLIGIVVPESMISSKKYAHVVEFICNQCYVKAVIGMPDDLFKTSGKGGTHTKTCLLILKKKGKLDLNPYDIFMAEAKWCGHDSRGREVPNDDIPSIADTYLEYIHKGIVPNTHLGFTISINDVENCVLAPRAYTYRTTESCQIDETKYRLITIGQLMNEGVLYVSTGDEVGKLSYGTGNVPFIRTSDISNWEIKTDPKHLLSDEIYNAFAEKQDVREGDILMVKDGSYLIGTCAMISKYDTKMVYQSHLYKIRVLENNYGIDRFYLLAALSSDYLKKQIMSKTFSQDIINSLGDRLRDLTIPIHRNPERIGQISNMVKCSVEDSIEARELAKKVRSEIFI